ncbi:MAG: hypothetical protein A4E60_01194 [Syntrophorhabdus sp. PtaB.Bin047]|jgi:uncharacterized lipoprotein YmbA|nr:MAG: hypothetical protein A4E60_01194 [Syntrophorhabdus sp. PtaB.Bin047]
MRHGMSRIGLLVATLVFALSAGCAVSVGTGSGYPALVPVPMPPGPYVVTQGKRLVVAVGPVNVPGYITRAATIVDSTMNAANISAADWKASALESQIPRVVAENVRRLLDPYGIEVFPDPRGKNADYRIAVDLRVFEVSTFDVLETQGRWVLYGPGGMPPMMERDIAFSTPLRESGDAGANDAMSRALADLTRGIVKDCGGALGIQ